MSLSSGSSTTVYSSNVAKSYLYRFLMDFQLWLPIWVLYLRDERGFSLTQINLLDTPFFLLIVVAEVPTGAIADRFGRRTSLLLGGAFFSVAVFVFGIADNFAIIMVSYVSWGLAITLQSGADVALLYDSLKQEGREADFQRINSRLWAVRASASLLGILIGAPVAAATSSQTVIVASSAIGALAVPVALWMREPPYRASSHEAYFDTLFAGIGDMWRAPALRYIVALSGIVALGSLAPHVFEQPFLADHGVSVSAFGFWQAPIRAAGILAALGATWWLARLGERGAFLSLPLLIAAGCLLLAAIDASWIFGAFILLGAVHGMHNPILARYVNHRIPSERRATMLSVQSVAASIALSAQPIGGLVADTYGLQAAFLMYGLLTLTAGAGLFALWDRAERRDVSAGSVVPIRRVAAS